VYADGAYCQMKISKRIGDRNNRSKMEKMTVATVFCAGRCRGAESARNIARKRKHGQVSCWRGALNQKSHGGILLASGDTVSISNFHFCDGDYE